MKKNKYLDFNRKDRLVFNNTHGKKITVKQIALVELWLQDKITLQDLARKTGTIRIPASKNRKGSSSVATVYILVARTLKVMFRQNKIKL